MPTRAQDVAAALSAGDIKQPNLDYAGTLGALELEQVCACPVLHTPREMQGGRGTLCTPLGEQSSGSALMMRGGGADHASMRA
eukprot:2509956-Rhodomonas_salina.2